MFRNAELSVRRSDAAPLGAAASGGEEKSLPVLCPPLPWPWDAAYLQCPAWGSEAVAIYCIFLYLTDMLLQGLRPRELLQL